MGKYLSFLLSTNPAARAVLTLEGLAVAASTLVNALVQLGYVPQASSGDLTKGFGDLINGVVIVVFVFARTELKKKMVESGYNLTQQSNVQNVAMPVAPVVPASNGVSNPQPMMPQDGTAAQIAASSIGQANAFSA